MSSMGIGNKPCLDIKPSEDQISDRSISIHQLARGKWVFISKVNIKYSYFIFVYKFNFKTYFVKNVKILL